MSPKLKIIFPLIVFFTLFFPRGVYSQETTRAYFRVKMENGLPLLTSFIHHDFGDGIFSIEAPRFIIERLSKNPLLEFRGEASLWKITQLRRSTQATCAPTSTIPWGVEKVKGGSGGSGIVVAVIDTGVNVNHPDIKSGIVDCKDAQTSRLKASCSDGNGHGTHVAGTVAANGKIKGVAPEAKIMAIKVCSNGGYCWSDDVARGIKYAADKGANIINLSLGGSSFAQDEKLAVDYAVGKGVLVVAAAGNSGPKDDSILYPAAYYKVISVAATNSSDSVADFSSRGNNINTTPYFNEERDVEFAAPGVLVESTSKNGCYVTYSGTSMATPHISGLSAKLWQGSADLTRNYLQDRARYNYSDIGLLGDDNLAGFGLPTAP